MDIRLIESGNGGDFLKISKGVDMVYSFQNMPYIALFGGNVTSTLEDNSQQNVDFWGNTFLDDPNTHFSSLTETTLKEVALNSRGLQLIEEAVIADLDFMTEFAELDISVSLISDDHIQISIKIYKPLTLERAEYIFIWSALSLEVVQEYTPSEITSTDDDFLQYELQKNI